MHPEVKRARSRKPRTAAGIVGLLGGAWLCAGCAVGPKYKRPEVTVPDQFRGASAPSSWAVLLR